MFNSCGSLQNNFKKVTEHFYYQKKIAQYITWPFFLIICSGMGCIAVKSFFFFHGVFFCWPRLGIETLPVLHLGTYLPLPHSLRPQEGVWWLDLYCCCTEYLPNHSSWRGLFSRREGRYLSTNLPVPYAPKIEHGDSTCAAVAVNTFPRTTVGVSFYPGGKGGAVGIVKRIFEVQQSDPLFLQATKRQPSLQGNRYH